MIIIELILHALNFLFTSLLTLISAPFILFSDASADEKVLTVKTSLFSIVILIGFGLLFVMPVVGVILILVMMFFGAAIVKDDGTI